VTYISTNSAKVGGKAAEIGFTFSGIADVREIRAGFLLGDKLRDSFPLAISLGFRLLDAVLEDVRDAPTPLYFHHYRQVNALLDRGALLLAAFIQDLGHRALPVAASQIIDWENQRGHISHKAVARLAGLGWIGRNNLLVHPEHGSRFRLVTVLTDLPLIPAAPLEFGCGACRACIAPCPAGAIGERPEEFDHRGCYEKLKAFRNAGLVAQFICGVCVRACRGPGPSRRS
jgi:epoxyqueuosine reductase QueG